jgi:hypothetical protein
MPAVHKLQYISLYGKHVEWMVCVTSPEAWPRPKYVSQGNHLTLACDDASQSDKNTAPIDHATFLGLDIETYKNSTNITRHSSTLLLALQLLATLSTLQLHVRHIRFSYIAHRRRYDYTSCQCCLDEISKCTEDVPWYTILAHCQYWTSLDIGHSWTDNQQLGFYSSCIWNWTRRPTG